MFCKKCGATISASDEKCTRCGYQTPELSECGGFYDLSPNAPKAAPAPVMPQMTAVSVEPPKSGNKLPLILLGALMLVILVLQVVLFVKLADHEAQIGNLFGQIEKLNESAGENPTDPTGDPVPEPSETEITEPSENQDKEPSGESPVAPSEDEITEPSDVLTTEPTSEPVTEPTASEQNELDFVQGNIRLEDDVQQDGMALVKQGDEAPVELIPQRDDAEGNVKIAYSFDDSGDRQIVVTIEKLSAGEFDVHCSFYGDFGTLPDKGSIILRGVEESGFEAMEIPLAGETLSAKVNLNDVSKCEFLMDNQEAGSITVVIAGIEVLTQEPAAVLLEQQDIRITDRLAWLNTGWTHSLGGYDGKLDRSFEDGDLIFRLKDHEGHTITLLPEDYEAGKNITVCIRGADFGTFSRKGTATLYCGENTDGVDCDVSEIRVQNDAVYMDIWMNKPSEKEDYKCVIIWPNEQGGSVTITLENLEF